VFVISLLFRVDDPQSESGHPTRLDYLLTGFPRLVVSLDKFKA
jgi:hypothetical protein